MDDVAFRMLKENAFWQLCFDQINELDELTSFCTECDDDSSGSDGEEDGDD